MIKKNKILIIVFCLAFAGLLSAGIAFAQTADSLLWGNQQTNIANQIGLGSQDPRILAANIIRVALGFLGIIALGLVIYAGWLWMTAAGNEEKISQAKKILTGAIIGILIILSSFLITTYILNRLLEATGGGGTPATCGDPATCDAGENCSNCPSDCGICPPVPGLPFQVVNFSPASPPDTIRNPVVRGYFTKSVKSSSVDPSNFKLYVQGGQAAGAPCAKNNDCLSDLCDSGSNTCVGDVVDGQISVAGKKIEIRRSLKPETACPAPNDGIACLSSFTDFVIEAVDGASGIKSTSDDELSCGGIGPECTGFFTTGDLVDVAPPEVALSIVGQLCVDTINTLTANATDDSGVADVEFFVQDNSIDIDSIAPYSADWNATSPPYSAGVKYEIKATASDLDDNSASDSENITLRAAHCCNAIKDFDEEGADCGGADCAACDGAACGTSMSDECSALAECSVNNDLCASSFCSCESPGPAVCESKGYETGIASCCLCQSAPVIDWITPEGGFCNGDYNTPCTSNSDCSAFAPATCNNNTANGAVGNLVTLGGRFFGATPGKVEFSDDNGASWTLAQLAKSVNANCEADWQDDQIIAVVPSGLNAGAGILVKVTTDSNFIDTTNDDRGPNVGFVVNTIIRPGLCQLNPDNGRMNDLITYQGINLNGSAARFGNTLNYVSALNSNFTLNTEGTAGVPNLQTGKTTSFVVNSQNINSNFLYFTKLAEAVIGPQIISFEPAEGAPGQYVTIFGSGFGDAKGAKKVFFGAEEASYDFPDICADSVWQDNQIIVKAPEADNGNYVISIDLITETIDTSGLSPSQFNLNDALALKPSLCKIRPIMGPNNIDIALWGEYFGGFDNITSKVRFHLNHDQSGINIKSWGVDADAEKIETTVHSDAATGPVRVVKDSPELVGNGINFTVGVCSQDPDCGNGSVCCPENSYKAGRCELEGTPEDKYENCFEDFSSSVFEWDFSTGTGPTPESCAGYSLNQCSESILCPNSPGQCSPYAGGEQINMGNCADSACEGLGACVDLCKYNSLINKCVLTGSSCDLPDTTLDALGNNIVKYCADYDSGGTTFQVWHIDTNLSCPATWTRISGNRCVDSITESTCLLCDEGFSCLDDKDADKQGLCGINQNICPAGSTCDAGSCVKIEEGTCECCCEIGQSARDCCAPLVCEGTCGSDTADDAIEKFGMCSGCANAGATQAERDAACNCEGTTGKYCDTLDPEFPNGVCKDIPPSDCDTNETQCGDSCCASALGCNSSGTGCACDPVTEEECGSVCCSISAGGCEDADQNKCQGCPPSKNLCDSLECCGESCAGEPGDTYCPGIEYCELPDEPVCPDSTPTCSEKLELTCLADPLEADCPYCCCVPGENNSEGLQCVADISPCTGAERGIYCGCDQDIISDTGKGCSEDGIIACGDDTCCHQRPAVASFSPQGQDVCRNSLISATFNETMNVSSFTGNIIVVGDYGSSACPAGTQYLARKDEGKVKQIFSRISKIVKSIFLPLFNKAEALDGNFCAITGAVAGIQNIDNTTTITFSPRSLLATSTTYYVIIKGDSNITDNMSEGVLSYYGISMDGPDSQTFNDTGYSGKIWSFTTMAEQAPNNGVCKISYLSINPSSYLFNSTENDLKENDENESDPTFDTIRDADKQFIATPYSSQGIALAEIAGVYEWVWTWDPGATSIIDFKDPAQEKDKDRQLFQVKPGVTDGKSVINARVDVSGSVAEPLEYYDVDAQVWVFICDNPWPPFSSNGTWAPWLDNCLTCDDSTGSCENKIEGDICDDGSGNCKQEGECKITNFELYYCRDAGGAGTEDDLPAILSGSTVIRGSSTDQNILKELYYFREQTPVMTGESGLTAVNQTDSTNGKVKLNWNAVAGVDGYKVYYGTKSETYGEPVAVSANTADIDGLTVGKTYYFAITSFYNTGAESEYSEEVNVLVEDKVSPQAPQNFSASPGSGEVNLSWDANIDDTAGYKVYYGVVSGSYGGTEDVDLAVSAVVRGLTPGKTYYFVVTAYDTYGNESPYSAEASATVQP